MPAITKKPGGGSALAPRILAVLFMDVVGYSKLDEFQLQSFVTNVLPKLANIIQPHAGELLELNSWGDAVVAVCDDPDRLARIGLELRDYFRKENLRQFNLPDDLQCRIALHAGKIMVGFDPIRGRQGVVGTQVNLAARVEPITEPGEVFATDAFERIMDSRRDGKISFDELGDLPLAKKFGSRRLFRVRWSSDTKPTAPSGASGHDSDSLRSTSTTVTRSNYFDVIGIGALNLDFVATRSRLKLFEPNLVAELERNFELGTERPVERTEIDTTLRQMGAAMFQPCLGGSSFNVMHGMACANRGLSLGYVGVAGESGLPDFDFVRRFHELGINSQFVQTLNETSGVCISYIHQGERSLLTCAGANLKMAELLKAKRDELIPFLGRTKLVHLTSFFDDTTAAELVTILRSAKEQNPWLRLSFDPGHHWVKLARKPDSNIVELLKLTDFLFLNNREFEILGHYRPGSSDISVAREVFSFCSQQSVLVVLKRYNQIKLFHKFHSRIKCYEHRNQVLSADQIEDATGAGDVFAAGFLLSQLIPCMELRDGIELGLKLVHSKLKTAGSSGFVTFNPTVEGFVDEVFRRASCEQEERRAQ